MVAGPVAPVTPAAAAVPAAVVPATAAEDWRAVLVAKEDWRAVLVAATAAEALGSAATVVAVGRADEAARTSVPCSDGCRCPDILSGCNRMTRSSCSSTNHLTSSTDSHAGTRNGHGLGDAGGGGNGGSVSWPMAQQRWCAAAARQPLEPRVPSARRFHSIRGRALGTGAEPGLVITCGSWPRIVAAARGQ